MNQVECKPGIYFDVPFEEYLSWDFLSNSKLSLAKRSAAHYRQGFKAEPTPSMRLGSLVHCGALEPLAIAKRYTFMPNYAKHEGNCTANGERSYSSATKFVKSMEDQFRSLNHDKTIVSEDDYDKMIGIVSSLAGNELAKDLFRDGKPEVSIVWEDSATGLLCKMRADWLRSTNGNSGQVVDLKTTVDATEFGRAIARYGYHRQMAFYRRGINAVLGVDAEPWIIAVESSAPYGCRAAKLDATSLEIGESEVAELLAFVAECKALDSWPSYSNPESWSVPAWYLPKESFEDVELIVDGEVLNV